MTTENEIAAVSTYWIWIARQGPPLRLQAISPQNAVDQYRANNPTGNAVVRVAQLTTDWE